MSVILESRAGDELICIEGFSASPDGAPRSWETSRDFRVGERVRYAGSARDEGRGDGPVAWSVSFDATDGHRYSASQSYFVTEDAWRGLKTYFARRLLREPRRRGPQAAGLNP